MDTPKSHESRYERGEIQKEIVKYVLNFEEGVSEPKIRKYLETNFGITAQKGIKIHLEKLLNQNLLTKNERRGGANIWIPNYGDGIPLTRFIAKELITPGFFTNNPDSIVKVFLSPGTQKLLDSVDILDLFYGILLYSILRVSDKFESLWWDEDEELDIFIKSAIGFSPALLCALFGFDNHIRIQFWSSINWEMISKIKKENAISFFAYHYIIAALLFESEFFKSGLKVIEVLKSQGVEFVHIESVKDILLERAKIQAYSRELILPLLSKEPPKPEYIIVKNTDMKDEPQ